MQVVLLWDSALHLEALAPYEKLLQNTFGARLATRLKADRAGTTHV